MSGKGKGNNFERVICKAISMWFTNQERDDVFWRTDCSGGRAKVRFKVGKSTFGQYGDIQASDPIGQPLINCVTIEVKCGYGDWSFANLLDKKTIKSHPFPKFLEQVKTDQANAKTPWYFLITKKDRCKPLITISKVLFNALYMSFGSPSAFEVNFMRLNYNTEILIIMALDDFFHWADPGFFINHDSKL